MLKRRETIIFIVLAVGIIILTILQVNETFFIYGIGQFLLYCVFACTFIYAVIRLIRDRREVSKLTKASPLIFGVLLTGFFFLVSYLVESDGGKRKLLTAGFDHDLNFVYVQLFNDGKFKLLNSGPFGGDFYRGAYSFNGDTLRIDNGELRNIYPSLTFILKQDNGNKFLDPVDTLKSIYKLSVYKDFR
ncbi:MAG: hypothetical protein V4685_08315 [Bacteroidota bacterium]